MQPDGFLHVGRHTEHDTPPHRAWYVPKQGKKEGFVKPSPLARPLRMLSPLGGGGGVEDHRSIARLLWTHFERYSYPEWKIYVSDQVDLCVPDESYQQFLLPLLYFLSSSVFNPVQIFKLWNTGLGITNTIMYSSESWAFSTRKPEQTRSQLRVDRSFHHEMVT